MQEDRLPLGLPEKVEPSLFVAARGAPDSRGGSARRVSQGSTIVGGRLSDSGGGSSDGVGAMTSPNRSTGNFRSRGNASSLDVVLHHRGTRSMPASPIQPPGSTVRPLQSPTGEGVSGNARKRLLLDNDLAFDAFTLPASSVTAVEDGGGEGEPLPPLRYDTPAAPTLAKADERSLSVKWSAAEEVSGSELLEEEVQPTLCYVLEMQPVPFSRKKEVDALTLIRDDGWKKIMEGTTREFHVLELKPGLKYAFRVACIAKSSFAKRPVESAGPSAPAVFRTLPAAPSAPNPITLASKERKALKFKWPVPEETGGFSVLKYTLELFPPPNMELHEVNNVEHGFTAVYEGTDTSYKVTKLSPGLQYFVRVKAENEIGPGPYSSVGQFRTAATVPSQPGLPACYAVGPFCAYLHWPPTQCNGSPITRYHVQMLDMTDGGETWLNVYTGPDTKCEIINLQAAQRYTFRLISENDVGRSTPSGGLDIFTAATFPTPPSSIAVTDITRTSGNLIWYPPSWDGGAPIINYEVQLFPKSAAALVGGLAANWVVVFQGLDTKCSLFGLRGGCTYRTRVCCYSAVGVSEFSTIAEFTTSPDLPEPLMSPTVISIGQESARLMWKPPNFDGGSSVKSYVLERAREGSSDWVMAYSGLELEAEVTGLHPGSQYVFRLHCTNSEGASPWTPPVSCSTRAAAPDQPSVPLLAFISGSGLSLTWEAPNDNGAPITAYLLEEVRIKEDGGIMFVQLYQGAERAFEVKGLTPFQEYGFRLRASNAAGQSEWGPVAIYRTSSAPPGKPEGVEAYSQSADGFKVEWRAPLSNNGCPVTLYFVELTSCNGKTRKLGAWSQIYQGSDTHCIVDGLSPGREYACRVRAANKMGEGSFCSPVYCKTLSAAPGPPGAPIFSQRAAQSLKVRWEAPVEQNGCLVSTYTLHMAPLGTSSAWNPGHSDANSNSWVICRKDEDGLSWQEVYNGVDSSTKISALQPGQGYAFRVTATNPVGTSPPGPCHAVVTCLSPPKQMVAPTVEAEVDGAGSTATAKLCVQWEPPSLTVCTSAPLSYEVEAVEIRAEGEKPVSGDKGRHTISVPKECCSCVVPGLGGEQSYTVRVRAVGVGGTGHSQWSSGTSVRTPHIEQVPLISDAAVGSMDAEHVQTVGKKSGKKTRQRKVGRAGAQGEEGGGKGKQGGLRSVKSATAKLPPKRKQPLLSRKTLGQVAQVVGGVVLMGLLVFLCILAYKTEWKPPPGQQRHYLEREWEAARERELKLQETSSYEDNPYSGIPEADQIKLQRLRVIYESAAHYTDQGLEVPHDLVQEAQSLELSPEAYAILSQLDPSYFDDQAYGGHYHDAYEDYGGSLQGGPYAGFRTLQHGAEEYEGDEYEDEEEADEEYEGARDYDEYRR